jgi:hypothetical protein
MTFDPMELPDVAGWKREFGADAGILEFIGARVGATAAVALAGFFWPTFIDQNGCVLLKEKYDPELFRQWEAKLRGDRPAIEAAINHVHLWDVFYGEAESVDDEALVYLADVLSKTWRSALREQFPSRSFVIDVSGDPDEYGPTITARSSED